jgi:glycosyltransferase involved in cell wall biosynthesis
MSLLRGYRDAGCRVALAVGKRFSGDPAVVEIPQNIVRRSLGAATRSLLDRGVRVLPRITFELSRLGDLPNELARRRGREPFHYPGTRRLLSVAGFKPQILHAHNLHRDYFDLRLLPQLSAAVPVVITMHDAWLLSGHCAHSLGCERWVTGCGHCPDLTIPPAIRRDATAFNWQRKRAIYARSRLRVAAPSRWLLEKVDRSMLSPAVIESRVIPNGVDLEIFRPGDRAAARARLGLPNDCDVLLFTALSIRDNRWKDYETLRAAVIQLAQKSRTRQLVFLAAGDDLPNENLNGVEIRFVPFSSEASRVAEFYRAADVYLHAARADTFPTSILEALACGTPVVATAVGGIVEQITDKETGMLTPPNDPHAMADAVTRLLENRELRLAMGARAVEDARRRFGRQRMIDQYLDWFCEILAAKPHEVAA